MRATQLDIAGIDKMKLLRGLWQGSEPALFFHVVGATPPKFDEQACREALPHFIDYFQGRAIKTNISGDTVDTSNYDRYNGNGKFEEVVNKIKKKQ